MLSLQYLEFPYPMKKVFLFRTLFHIKSNPLWHVIQNLTSTILRAFYDCRVQFEFCKLKNHIKIIPKSLPLEKVQNYLSSFVHHFVHNTVFIRSRKLTKILPTVFKYLFQTRCYCTTAVLHFAYMCDSGNSEMTGL